MLKYVCIRAAHHRNKEPCAEGTRRALPPSTKTSAFTGQQVHFIIIVGLINIPRHKHGFVYGNTATEPPHGN